MNLQNQQDNKRSRLKIQTLSKTKRSREPAPVIV